MKRIAAILCLCLACLLLGACSRESATAAEQAADNSNDAGLTISIDQLDTAPTFWDWIQNGVAMQVIALLDSAGKPHVAYNTCQVCMGSPYAYFEYQNGQLYCMNCGNAFSLESVGQKTGGCTPLPVDTYAQTETAIVIPTEELQRAADSFAKKGL